MRNAGAQSLASWSAAVLAGHIRARPSFVDEDELLAIEVELTVKPCLSPLHDIRAVLLACMGGLFFQVMLWRPKKRHSAPILKQWPRSASRA